MFCTVKWWRPSSSSNSHSQTPSALFNPTIFFSPCKHERLSRKGDDDRPEFQGRPSRLRRGPPLEVSVSMDPTNFSLESGWPIDQFTVYASRTKLTRWVASNGHGAARRLRLLTIFTGGVGRGAQSSPCILYHTFFLRMGPGPGHLASGLYPRPSGSFKFFSVVLPIAQNDSSSHHHRARLSAERRPRSIYTLWTSV